MRIRSAHPLPYVLSCWGLCLTGFAAAFAEPNSAASILLPPTNLERYSDPINPAEAWPIYQHGLRGGPLHPLTWGTRRDQRTESARVISIKRYYLRSSEDPGYRIDRMKIVFAFRKVSKRDIELRPHEKESVIEFEFGATVELGVGGALAPVDKGFGLRLSALPPVPSGLFFRSQILTSMLAPLNVPKLQTNRVYTIEGTFSDETAAFTLNGVPLTKASGKSMNAGLVSLISGWNPASMTELEVDGHIADKNGLRRLHESGLVLLRDEKQEDKKKRRKRPARGAPPALTDNKELDKTLMRPVEETAE